MKEEKKSFIVYCDIEENLDRMTDEEVGILFRSMVRYSNTGEEPELDRLMTFIFTPIRQQMDRDQEKWKGIKESRSRAGKKGGEKSAKARAERTKTLQEDENDVIKSKQRLKNPSKRSKSQANQAVNVNVNVNENVNVNVNDNVIQLAGRLCDRLGDVTGAPTSPSNEVLNDIADLLEEGYSEIELFNVMEYQIKNFTKDCKSEADWKAMSTFVNADLIFTKKTFQEAFNKMTYKGDEEPPTDERHPERAETETEASDGQTA